jgi:O-antigen ligase
VGALIVLAVFQARDFGQFVKRIFPVIFIGAIFLMFVFPYLNNFTGGKLEERFDSTDTTNRSSIMEMELQIFAANPVFGVGVGEAVGQRVQMSQQLAASHTEFTRLISEHGGLGVLAILSLVAASVYNLRKQTTRTGKALVAGSLVWAGLFMGNAGMRLAAPAFMWGLSFVLIVDSNRSRNPPATRHRQRVGAAPPMFRKKRVLPPEPEGSEQS